MAELIGMWVVYDHPRDFPLAYVARMFAGDKPTSHMLMSENLEAIRDCFARQGLTRLNRFPHDDPVIIEVWL